MKIIRKDGKAYLEMPDEFYSIESAEFFKLRDGYYLLTVPLGEQKAARVAQKEVKASIQIPTESEKKVLKHLLSIKFQNRTPLYVEKVLSAEEKKVLKDLEKKNFINVFKGRKYPDGVYNINDKVYSTLYGKKTVTGKGVKRETIPSEAVKKDEKLDPASSLDKKGYAVGTSKDLKDIIDKNKSAIKSGKIKGLKGFDGRFYIARMDYVFKMSPLIVAQLDKERTIEEIAGNLKIEPDAVRTVLHILAEAGDVIEKRKGVYAAV